MNKPKALDTFMYAMMNEVCRTGLYDFFEEEWGLNQKEVDRCIKYIEYKLGVKL